ncbi:MAG: hypothetical protein MK106_15675 [Mariniblastus sp.]|nr:hypothetical protein [Mariniblastus sp.]
MLGTNSAMGQMPSFPVERFDLSADSLTFGNGFFFALPWLALFFRKELKTAARSVVSVAGLGVSITCYDDATIRQNGLDALHVDDAKQVPSGKRHTVFRRYADGTLAASLQLVQCAIVIDLGENSPVFDWVSKSVFGPDIIGKTKMKGEKARKMDGLS